MVNYKPRDFTLPAGLPVSAADLVAMAADYKAALPPLNETSMPDGRDVLISGKMGDLQTKLETGKRGGRRTFALCIGATHLRDVYWAVARSLAAAVQAWTVVK